MNLQDVAESVQWHMNEMLKLFKPGRKITVLVRSPEQPTADFCMTNDDLVEVATMVQRRIEQERPADG